MSLREIARELNRQRIPTARGRTWHAGKGKYILEIPLYKGILNYESEKTKKGGFALIV